MHLRKLSVINFKNCAEAEFEFSSRVNCFLGNNGEGKTNLLDAIYYLSFCKSYFNPMDRQNIMHEKPFFVVHGTFDKNGKDEDVYCGLKKNQKKQFKRNKKEYQKLSEHIGLFPVVMITPYDTDIISEGSEIRRKFIDTVISQYDKHYLDSLILYKKALTQRNVLLKQFSEQRVFRPEVIEPWDFKLIEHGELIYHKRKEMLENFIPIFNDYFKLLTRGKENVSIDYQSHLTDGSFENQLKESQRKDQVMGYTTVGVHKDDLIFKIGDYPIKKFGSQGQQKSFLVALKLAQYDYIKSVKGMKPILLLDDIFDKLDNERVQQLMNMVAEEDFGQVFITDTDLKRIPILFADIGISCNSFEIHDGMVMTQQMINA